MNPYRRMTIFIICAVLALSFYVPARADRPEPGTVRILLGESSKSSRMDISVYGSYLVNGIFSFQRGSKLKVEAKDSSIWLYYEGASINAGDQLILKRQSSKPGDENGLRLNDSLSLLEGDLAVSLSGSMIRTVLHIGIEDYLKGLVPYEMSDSFPLEALKAQAIAARSYAVRGIRPDRDYDLSDDTNDQVYRGLLQEHTRAHRAVKETEGIVLTYNEQIIQAYYTASNGGETESSAHAWGGEGFPYLPVREDKYDAENPQSPVKSFYLPKDWTAGTPQHQDLETLLISKLAPSMEKMGYSGLTEDIRINNVKALSANAPMYSAESRLMTKLSFQLNVSGRRQQSSNDEEEVLLFTVDEKNAPQTASAPVSENEGELGPFVPLGQLMQIDLDIFPGLEKLMGLSINLKENEIVKVIEESEGFIIRSGRYGHGVGMSQRGAEWMAKQYGKNYQEILAFYYPGTKESRYRTMPAARPYLNAEFLTTPGPIPTPTPRPTLVPQSLAPEEGQWEVIVKNINQNSSLNLRILPNTSSDILYQLYYGQRLLVLKRADGGWLHVRADGVEGYVMESFVEEVPE